MAEEPKLTFLIETPMRTVDRMIIARIRIKEQQKPANALAILFNLFNFK
jgi:hypothetical protein